MVDRSRKGALGIPGSRALALLSLIATLWTTLPSRAASETEVWYGGDSPVFAQTVPQSFAADRRAADVNPYWLAQSRLRFLRAHIGELVAACLEDHECRGTGYERKILDDILRSAEGPELGVLYFANEEGEFVPPLSEAQKVSLEASGLHARPPFNGAAGAHRFAVTRLVPGPVVFNNDRLRPAPSYFALTILLVHELGHQTGISDDAERRLDSVGSRVARRLEKLSQDILVESSALELFVPLRLGVGRREGAPLLFSDGRALVDLSPLVEGALYRVVDVPALRGYEVTNLHWKKNGAPAPQGRRTLFLEGDLRYVLSRRSDSPPSQSRRLLGTVQFAIPVVDEHYAGDPITVSSYALRDEPLGQLPDLRLESLKAARVIEEGADFRIEAMARSASGKRITGAVAVLTSDDFLAHPIIVPTRLFLSAETRELLADGSARLSFRFRFLPGTPARVFQVDSLIVATEGVRSPARLIPTFRTLIDYRKRSPSPPFRLVGAQIYSVYGKNPLSMVLKVHENNERIPLSLYPESKWNSANVQMQIESPGSLVKMILILEGYVRDESGQLRPKPFLVSVTESTQDGVLRTGKVKRNEKGQWNLELEINPNRLPREFESFRFKGVKVVSAFYQEGLFSFTQEAP